jgi:hypothetical protein
MKGNIISNKRLPISPILVVVSQRKQAISRQIKIVRRFKKFIVIFFSSPENANIWYHFSYVKK